MKSHMSTTLPKPVAEKAAAKVVAGRKAGASAIKKDGGGVVHHCVHVSTLKSELTPAKLIEVLRAGLPFEELRVLKASLGVPMDKLAPMLGISKATLHRRQATGRLDQAESDRIVRFAKLIGKAVDVMESEGNARKWLGSPQFGLGGAVPLEYAETEFGAREVEDLLARIEYGVYS